MAGLQSLLEDYRNWNKTQDWKLQKQREQMFGGDYQLAEDIEKWGGGFGPSNLGGVAGAIKAYHGSPSAFTKFLMSKLGTGEGAQAYGHGLYFAQAPETASDYARTLSRQAGEVGKIGKKTLSDLYMQIENKANRLPPALAGKEYEKLAFLEDLELQPTFKHALERIDDPDVEAWAKTLESQYQPPGHMYEVSLEWPNAAKEAADPLGEHHLLDWDAPLSEQPESVQKYWTKLLQSKIGALADKSLRGALLKQEGQFSNPTGQDIYSTLSEGLIGYGKARPFLRVKEEASNRLARAGIPGIRYLDQASRGVGEGTRNYVMFDENIPRIVSRNNVSLTDLLRK